MFFSVSIVEIELIWVPGDLLGFCCSEIPSFCRTSLPIKLCVLCPTTRILQFWAVHEPECRVMLISPSILILLLLKHLYFVWLVYCWCFTPGLCFMISVACSLVMKLLGDPVSANHCIFNLFVVVSTQISFGVFVFNSMSCTSLNESGAIWLISAQSSDCSFM